MENSKQYTQLIEDCFWDYNMSDDDIIDLAKSHNIKEQQFLFGKILINSTHLLNDIEIFDKKDLEHLLMEYTAPTFNHNYIARRKNMIEYYFFDKPLLVNELKWVV